MGTNITPTNVRGFVLPFDLTADHYWAAESTATQGTARAGLPQPQTPTTLTLLATGTQTQDINVKTLAPGHIGDNATFGWKLATDTAYYGHNVPNVVTDVTSIVSLSLAGQSYTPRKAITLPNGAVVVCYEHTTATTNVIRIVTINTDGTTTIKIISTVQSSTLSGQLRYPTLCVMPDNSILCFYWAVDIDNLVANITVQRSTDSGANWDIISYKALYDDVDISGTFGAGQPGYNLNRITVAASAAQLLMFVSLDLHNTSKNNQNIITQYASVSQGVTFSFIEQSDPDGLTYKFYWPDIIEHNGVFVITWFNSSDSMNTTRIVDAFDSLFNLLLVSNPTIISGTFCTVSGNRLISGDKTMHIDTDGRIYVYTVNPNKYQVYGAFTDCAGKAAEEYAKKWYLFGTRTTSMVNGPVVKFAPNNGGMQNIISTYGNGQQFIFTNWYGANPYKNSVIRVTLGCWATVQYPYLRLLPHDYDFTKNTFDYLPSDFPQIGSAWTRAVTGTPTEILTAGRLEFTTTTTQAISYTKTITDKTNGLLFHVKLDGVTGGSTITGTYIDIKIQPQSGSTTFYNMRIYFTQTAVYVRDQNAAIQIGSLTGLTFQGYTVYGYLDNKTGDILVYFADIGGPRKYQRITGSLTAAAGSTQTITFGTTTSVTNTTCKFAYVSFCQGVDCGIEVPTTNFGKQYPANGYKIGVHDGLYLTTQDGPARNTDVWDITPMYDYPISRTLYLSSRTRGNAWRSDSVATPDTLNVPLNTIAWALDKDNKNVDQRITNSILGIGLYGINFRSFTIQRYTAGAWANVGTVDNNVGGQFDFIRQGKSIIVDSVVNNAPYMHYNECAGWYLLLIGAGVTLVRKVKTNCEGVLSDTNTTKRCVLELESVQPTDPTTGAAYLIPNACTVICHDISDISGNDVAAIRIMINSQRTYEGYHTIGHMVMGPVVLPAHQYSRGRTINWEADISESTQPNGVLNTKVLGNGGRNIRIAWSEGVDITDLYAQNADPNYYTTKSGSPPEAVQGSAPTTMFGIVQAVQGSNNAVVYLPKINTQSLADIDVINRYHDHAMVTMGRDVQIENVIGDESQNEVLRVSTVVLREVR